MQQNRHAAVVSPTPSSFPWVPDHPLPTAATVSLMGLIWAAVAPAPEAAGSLLSSALDGPVRNKLQCYALQQVRVDAITVNKQWVRPLC
jgi:hypothetical protein